MDPFPPIPPEWNISSWNTTSRFPPMSTDLVSIWLFATLGEVVVFALLVWWTVRKRRKIESKNLRLASGCSIDRKSDDECLDIAFAELGLELENGSTVLSGVTGNLAHGELTAIMGPSGAGKSTFLAALSGRASYGRVSGTVTLNGRVDSLTKSPRLVGFVPQEDIMPRMLTVRQILEFNALCRLPASWSHASKLNLVDRVIAMLQLSSVAGQMIGDENVRGISGGQRKRVNLAIELVSDPTVLFLDEPTSGLDAASTMELLRALRELGEANLTIAAVVHQPRPEAFRMFHKLLLLGKGGRTVYLGPTAEVGDYFRQLGFPFPDSVNPADFCLDIVGGEIPHPTKPDFGLEDLCREWEQRCGQFHTPFPPINGDYSEEFQTEQRRWDSTIGWFLFAFFLPLLVLFSFYKWDRGIRNLDAQLGGLLGFSFSTTLCLTIPLCLFFGLRASAFTSLDWTIFGGLVLAALSPLPLLVLSMRDFLRRRTSGKLLHLYSTAYNPLNLLPILLMRRTSIPNRLYGLMGFGFWLLGAFLFPVVVFIVFSATSHSDFPTLYQPFLVLPVAFGISGVLVAHHRSHRIPSDDRKVASFWHQTLLQAKRAIEEILARPSSLLFDLGLPWLTGLFVGSIFYGIEFQPPLLEKIGSNCPGNLSSDVCRFLAFPPSDPFPAIGSMASIGLCLSSVTSSLRLFDSVAVFRREQDAGISTGAYYIGRSSAHLLILLLAPFFFLTALFTFVRPIPEGNSYLFIYLVYLLSYLACSGVAYAVSIALPGTLATLVSILIVLVMVLFAGQTPSLYTLEHAKLVPYVLYLPTFLSVPRWSIELFYILATKSYDIETEYMTVVYGFKPQLEGLDWSCLICLAVISRLVAWTIVVKKER